MEASTTTIQSLLNQVSGIVRKYDELAALTGENFNIFNILGLSTREVRLHSSLLAELLNPNGSHGMKDIFLKLFVDKLYPVKPDETNGTNERVEKDRPVESSVKPVELFEIKGATVKVEKWIGNLNKEKTEGGYIDIYIKNSANQSIVIENKIYAGDQEGQLRRYHNFDKTAKLVYLTLSGEDADDYTTKNHQYSKITPICISYADHIKDWLEKCREKATNHPILRETITQYIYLIKYLTNQTTNKNMENELVKLILGNPEHIKSVQQIFNVWKNVDTFHFQIIQNLKTPIEEIAKELALEHNFSAGKLGENESGFWFYKKDESYCIYFYFESIEKMLVGVGNIPNSEKKCSAEIESNLKAYLKEFQISSDRNDDDWFWGAYFKDWETTSWADVASKMRDAILETTTIILAKLEGFEKPSI